MDEVHHLNRICHLCGKSIDYTTSYSDGTDWLGHHRGQARAYTNGYDCECDSIKFKKMCLNCAFFDEKTCLNKEILQEYKSSIETKDSPFQLEKIEVKIKKPTNSCRCWKIDDKIANEIFE